MTSARTIKGCIAVALLALGCGADAPKTAPEDTFEELTGFDEAKADQFSTKMKLVGSLSYGQTSSAVRYHNPPLYRAFKFGGAKGDQVKIDVTSTNGDAVAWLVDNKFKIIATNDDASRNTLDSHIEATLPGNTNPSIVTYYIMFREYAKADATFKVRLQGGAAGQFCGGIAGIACPAGQQCIDNPNDSCDPNNGGADCGGICVPEPPAPSCDGVRCSSGNSCRICRTLNGPAPVCLPTGAVC